MHSLSSGDIGPEVAKLHQALVERGAWPRTAPGELDKSVFGPATVGAVKTFQAKAGLTPDGIVGDRTWLALNDFSGQGVPADSFPAILGAKDIGQYKSTVLMLADQEAKANVCEQPLGSNRGPRVDAYLRGVDGSGGKWLLEYRADARYPGGYQGAPWCGRFAKWCIDRAAYEMGITSVLAGWGDLASALKWQVKGLAAGKWVDKAVPGCVGVILIPGGVSGEAHGHVVLVADVVNNNLSCIEGNSENRVMKRWRNPSEFAGFVRLENL